MSAWQWLVFAIFIGGFFLDIAIVLLVAVGVRAARRLTGVVQSYLEVTKQYQAATVRNYLETTRTVGEMSDRAAEKAAAKAAEVAVKETVQAVAPMIQRG